LAPLSDVRAQADSQDTSEVESFALGEAPTADDDSDADIVEVLDDSPAPPPPPPSAALSSDRFELHGWAREQLSVGFSRQAFRSDSPDVLAPDYDQLISRTHLFVRARYSRERWFEANVSGWVGYSLYEQAPASADHTFNGFNGQSTTGEVDSQLYEAFLGFYTPHVDLRFGQQRVAWGRADFISPNDVLNARDARDPLLSETEQRTQPTLLARADIDLGFGSLQGIFQPAYVPDRFDMYGSNWAAVQPDAPASWRGLVGLLRRASDPTLRPGLQRPLQGTQLPRSNLTQPVVAARFAWSAGGLDVNHYYQYGFDGPLAIMQPDLAMTLANIDFENAGLADLAPVLRAIDEGGSPLRVRYVRRHHVGLDLSTVLGKFAVRIDAGFQDRRVFFRYDLQGTTSPSFQGVLSVEYQTGEPDKGIQLELIYLRILDPLRAPLLFYERNTLGGAFLLRWSLVGPFSFELRALVGAQPWTAVLQPQLNLREDAFTFSVGGLWLDGAELSFGHYFHRNSSVYLRAKYVF
jgi:hypothetical protein